MRILLVEDEKELSRALAQMLMKDGYDVDCVYDGADGLNFASTGMYDMILEKHPDLFHLDDGDYNIYFMPNNKEETVFLQT